MTPPDPADAATHVRITRPELYALRAFHVNSMLSERAVLGVYVLGRTQWGASWEGADISIAWSWGVVRDVVSILDPTSIDSNIVLILDDATSMPRMLSCIHLFEWIETLPWRHFGIPDLLASQRSTP